MAINVSVQYKGGFLPGILLYYTAVVDPMLLPSGKPFKCHGEFFSLQPKFPPKRSDNFSP